MSEDNTIRAIVIGVFLFMFIFTITAIIMYYNAAVGVADTALSTRVDFDKIYEEDLKAMKGKTVSGTELINAIRKIPDFKTIKVCLYDPLTDILSAYYDVSRYDNKVINDANLSMINKGNQYEVTEIYSNTNDVSINLTIK